MFDDRGLVLDTKSAGAAEGFNRAVRSYLDYGTTTADFLAAAITADPNFCAAHCLQGYLGMMANSAAGVKVARSAYEEAVRCAPNADMRIGMHLAALGHLVEGNRDAAIGVLEQILGQYPLDIIALRVHHLTNFWLGRAPALRAGPAGVLSKWEQSLPGYGTVLGMLAFGYEECGQYDLAEHFGRKAVACNGKDLWAIHSVAHVLEMSGRAREGRDWLGGLKEEWRRQNPFKGHLWWHLCLFLFDEGEFEVALSLYDEEVYKGDLTSHLDMQNAASLLARLEFAGVNVGDRWTQVADIAARSVHDHSLLFTDLHHVMALARDGRFALVDSLLASMRQDAASNAFGATLIREVGIPVCESILAFEQKRYNEAMQSLLPLRPVMNQLGASHAQRDILALYIVEAAIRGGSRDQAEALLQDRLRAKPYSVAALRQWARAAQLPR